MTDTHETIADIIAEKRFDATTRDQFDSAYIVDLCDRIEAAHKRERENYDAKIADLQLRVKLWTDRSDELVKKCVEQYAKLKQVGNAAKLREALDMVRDAHYTKEVEGELYEGFEVEVDDGTGRPLICIVKNALAAPPRNCDRFATVDEARKAHEAICEKYGKCHNGCPLNNEEHYSAFDCFEAWLFAPATEKEGGAK